MPPTKSTKTAQARMYRSTVNVLTTKQRFEGDLTQNVYDAWTNRTSERYLYTVYSHILSNLCSTIEPLDFPDSTLSFSPQALFGTLKPPEGEPNVKAKKKKRLYKTQIPDYVRVFISRDDSTEKTVRHLVDLWEIKELNSDVYWLSEEVNEVAREAMINNIEQVYHQAMSAFSHNPEWEWVHALLIVGVYFSQFVWKRPASKIERPFPPLPSLSHLAPQQVPELIRRIEARIKHYEARPLPEIEYFNAPVLFFDDSDTQVPGGKVSLSPQFLYAVQLPLKQDQTFEYKLQPSWFSSPSTKPAHPRDETAIRQLTWKLRGAHVERMQIRIDTINSPATTASTSSVGYQPDYRLKKVAEQLSPLANKGQRLRNQSQKLQLVAGPESSEDSEDEVDKEEESDSDDDEQGDTGGDDGKELEYVDEPSNYVEEDEESGE